jgi:hypothetical protein
LDRAREAGALSPAYFPIFMARLKSCPDTKQSFSAAREVVPSGKIEFSRSPVRPLAFLYGQPFTRFVTFTLPRPVAKSQPVLAGYASSRDVSVGIWGHRLIILNPGFPSVLFGRRYLACNRSWRSSCGMGASYEEIASSTRIFGNFADQIPDLETARKAASLLVPELNARKAKSKSVSMTIAQLCSHFEYGTATGISPGYSERLQSTTDRRASRVRTELAPEQSSLGMASAVSRVRLRRSGEHSRRQSLDQ